TGFKNQTCRDRKIEVQSLGENGIALLWLQIAFGVGSKIAKAAPRFCARMIYLDRDLAEFAVPVLVLRIISQGVIGRAVINTVADGCIDVVAVVERLSAGPFRQILHGAVVGEERRGFVAQGLAHAAS